jgi:hypothetical protein
MDMGSRKRTDDRNRGTAIGYIAVPVGARNTTTKKSQESIYSLMD